MSLSLEEITFFTVVYEKSQPWGQTKQSVRCVDRLEKSAIRNFHFIFGKLLDHLNDCDIFKTKKMNHFAY